MSRLGLTHSAYRWELKGGNMTLVPVIMASKVNEVNLIGLDEHSEVLMKNIKYLLSGNTALNVLLWGEKGAGKSTLVKLMLHKFVNKNLKVIELNSDDYTSIYELYRVLRTHSDCYFVIYIDDVTFDESNDRYRNFKSIVEGGLEERPGNSIFIVTSNRRHMISEKARGTKDIYSRDDENETTSLYARFGISLGFYPLSQEIYLDIVEYYMAEHGLTAGVFEKDAADDPREHMLESWKRQAITFAVDRGGRSGRVAQQFAIYNKILRNF